MRYDEVTASWDAQLAALKAQRHEHTRQLRAVRKEASIYCRGRAHRAQNFLPTPEPH